MMMELEELPKGFRFRPTDEELVSHYLRLKINGRHSSVQVIPEVDVCKWEPWDLPALSVIKSDDPEWFFFWPRDRKYPNGHRSNRATEAGYWKATGKDRTIKSLKSLPFGRSSIHSIGMKKTLVFYMGRAPKGERTNWVMHEYRATEPDLDGSGPGQGDYVLCRLFHKADENLNNSNYDDVQPAESSPSTGKSAPDDVSLDLFQQPAVLGMEILKELKDVKEQWVDGVDHLNPTNVVPADKCESSGVHHLVEKATMDVHASLREIPMSEETNNYQHVDEVFDTMQSNGFPDSGAYISSPFADDFGYNPNGLHFQDGTSEQDVSLSELLEGLPNVDNYFHAESTTYKNLVVTSENLLPEQINGLEQTPTIFCEANICKIHEDAEKEILHSREQTSPIFFQAAPSPDHFLSRYAVEEDVTSVNIATSSHYKLDDSPYDSYLVKDSSTADGTGIRIRSRHPRNERGSVNSATQGTTSRRICLLIESGSSSVHREKSKDANSDAEHELHSLVTETSEDIYKTSKSHEPEGTVFDKTEEIAQTCDPRLELPMKHADKKGGPKMAFMSSATLFIRNGTNYLNTHVVSIYLVIFLSVVFLGMWKWPSLPAPYG